MKHIFIVNSISGKGKGLALVDTIKQACKELAVDYEIITTEYVGHAKEIAAKYTSKDDVTLYAVGGDGTLLEIVNGLDHKIPLGAIPGGSGEDFLRYFHLDVKDIKKYIIDTIKAEPILIDIGETDRMKFLNTTSFGIDATINEEASQLIRKTFITKGPAYILSIIKNVIIIRATKARIVIDGKRCDDDYLIVACMNGKYYGNGVCAAKHSNISDGYFDLARLHKIKGLSVYKHIVYYLTGKGEKSSEIKIDHAKHIVVDTDKMINIQSDGENYKSNHLEITILEKYLKLKIPQQKQKMLGDDDLTNISGGELPTNGFSDFLKKIGKAIKDVTKPIVK